MWSLTFNFKEKQISVIGLNTVNLAVNRNMYICEVVMATFKTLWEDHLGID